MYLYFTLNQALELGKPNFADMDFSGICLAMGGADIRVASNKASMGFTFVKLGLHPGMAATHFLPMIAGQQVLSRFYDKNI